MKLWLGELNSNLNLVYRGGRDGFSKENFNALTIGEAPCLILIRSENGQVFGGYRTIPFKDENVTKYADRKAFVFSLTHLTKHASFKNSGTEVQFFSDSLVQFSQDI